MHDEEPARPAKAVGQSIAALAGYAIDGPAGAVVGAASADPMVSLVGAAWNELRGRRERNVVRLVDRASKNSGREPVAFLEHALNDPRSSRLLDEALRAAAAAEDIRKIAALARALANGVDDEARVDEETIVVRALIDLDPIHARTLATIQDAEPISPSALRIKLYDNAPPGTPDLTRPILAVLERHGLVVGTDSRLGQLMAGGGGDSEQTVEYRCSRFGATCIQRLKDGGTDAIDRA